MDVAGTYIVATLPGFSTLSRKKKILRMALHNMTKQGIRDALHNADSFDWQNADRAQLNPNRWEST
jgi:DNA topoisomerase IA